MFLIRLTKNKERERTKITNIGNKREDIIIHPMQIKKVKEYYK